jgi:hypothetical protein
MRTIGSRPDSRRSRSSGWSLVRELLYARIMQRRLSTLWAVVVLGLAAGCNQAPSLTTGNPGTGGSPWTNVTDGSVAATACDPLTPAPITLGAIIGVGQDAAGTLYVDAANGIFVSDAGQRIRQHVVGTGQSGSTEFTFAFQSSAADGGSAGALLVETNGSTAIAMALGPAGSRSFLGQSDAGVTSLTLVAASTVAGMMVVNTPNVISYVGDVANGDVVLATVPLNTDATSDDGGLSIFYGPPNDVAQRTITAFGQSLSGNGSVTFLVGDVPYVLAFGNVQDPNAGPLGRFALEGLAPRGGAQIAVTLRSPTPAADPPGLSFTCLPAKAP